jgi:hypothetical protein
VILGILQRIAHQTRAASASRVNGLGADRFQLMNELAEGLSALVGIG